MSGALELHGPLAPTVSVDEVARVLGGVRVAPRGLEESVLVDAMAEALREAGFRVRREVRFGRGCRADLWIDADGGAVVVEAKKGRPDRGTVLGQLARYAARPGVAALVLVAERRVDLPALLEGKPVRAVGLGAAWGIAP